MQSAYIFHVLAYPHHHYHAHQRIFRIQCCEQVTRFAYAMIPRRIIPFPPFGDVR